MWVTLKQVSKCMEEEGFTRWDKHTQSAKGFENNLVFANPRKIHSFLCAVCPTREDLPRVLLGDIHGGSVFGIFNWEQGVKRVLCRLLQGGPV